MQAVMPAKVLRGHRRFRSTRPGREQGIAQSEAETPNVKKQSPPPAPPPPSGDAGKGAKEKPAEPSPEPMGPPPPPEQWTAAEVEAGRKECNRLLSGLHALFEPVEPIRKGACGLAAPIRLKGFENGHGLKLFFSPAPVISCKLTEALGRWIDKVVQPDSICTSRFRSSQTCQPTTAAHAMIIPPSV